MSVRLNPSECLRAEPRPVERPPDRAASSSARRLAVVGPPRSGKTCALAARAQRFARIGRVVVVCSHESSRQAFCAALGAGTASVNVAVATLEGHLLDWLRANYASSGVPPNLEIGGPQATKAILGVAATGLLDLSWPMLRGGDADLDLPFLSHPDAFLDAAAAFFRTLRRTRVTPDELERVGRAGAEAFYGLGVESALARVRDPDVRAKMSKRSLAACGVDAATLEVQRRAEENLVALLAQLYREYVAAAQSAQARSAEDVIDDGMRWLQREPEAARALVGSLAGLIVDDAEDAEPALPALVALLEDAGLQSVTLAGCEDAAVDAFDGRRTMLKWFEADETVTLAPPAPPQASTLRFNTEEEEIEWLAEAVKALLRDGVPADDLAVLARSSDAAALYAAALERRGVPTVPPPDRFAAEDDVQDLLALAAVVENQDDNAEHLLRVLCSPLLAFNDATVWALCRAADEPSAAAQLQLDIGQPERRAPARATKNHGAVLRNVWSGDADERLSAAARSALAAFRARLLEWRRRAQGAGAPATLAMLAAEAGFLRRWDEAGPHRRGRLLDDARRLIETAIQVSEDAESGALGRLASGFADGEVRFRPASASPDAVACDTIVGVKGRAFARVFVAGVAHERFPRIYLPRLLAFTPTFGVLARENVAGGPTQTAKYAWYYAKYEAKRRYLDEELRALRYGLSRGSIAATATGFGAPPAWAAGQDLLCKLGCP